MELKEEEREKRDQFSLHSFVLNQRKRARNTTKDPCGVQYSTEGSMTSLDWKEKEVERRWRREEMGVRRRRERAEGMKAATTIDIQFVRHRERII